MSIFYETKLWMALMMAAAAITASHASGLDTGKVRLACNPQTIRHASAMHTESEGELLLFEDFSGFTAGSVEEPDETMLPESYFTDNDPMIPAEYTQTPGWWGMGIYQAGGTCFLGYPKYGGVLTTPPLNLNGKIRVSFRAKASEDAGVDGTGVILCFLNADPYNPVKICETYKYVDIGNEWADYSYTFDIDYTGDDACLQIDGVTYDNGKFIDDIRIERIGTFLSTPKATEATEYTGDSFVANWLPQIATDEYLLTAFTSFIPEGEDITDKQNFDDADSLPEGFSGNNLKVASIDGMDGDKAIELGQGSELIIDSPGGVFRDFRYRFWMQLAEPTDQKIESPVYIDGWDGTSWQSISISTVGNRTAKPDNLVDLGNLEDKYPAFFRFHNLYSKVRIIVTEEPGYRFYFDDLEMVSSQPIEITYACNETPVKGTSHLVDGLDPDADYIYYVTAVNGEEKSAKSNTVKVYQLVKPLTTEATDIDPRGGFTANWNSVPKAEEYQAICYRVTDVAEDNEAYPLLHETFGKAIKEGYTRDEPYLVGNDYESASLDDLADNIGWSGIGLAYAENLVGCGKDMGLNQLESPVFDASHDGGRFTVSFKCHGNYGEMLVVQNSEISYQYVTLKEGTQEYSVTFEDGAENSSLIFYVMNGTPFLIGDLKVTQSLKAGEQIRTCLETGPWNTDTSHYFSNVVVNDEEKIGYTVQARYNRDHTWYYSPLSDVEYVSAPSGVGSMADTSEAEISVNGRELIVTADESVQTVVFSIDGKTVASCKGSGVIRLAKGVYIVKTGDTTREIVIG